MNPKKIIENKIFQQRVKVRNSHILKNKLTISINQILFKTIQMIA